MMLRKEGFYLRGEDWLGSGDMMAIVGFELEL